MDRYVVIGVNIKHVSTKHHKKDFDGLMIYFWWNVWKEQNRRTFQQQELQARQL